MYAPSALALALRYILLALLLPLLPFLILSLSGCGPRRDEIDGGGLLPVFSGANVIVVSFDAMRPDALGLYGGSADISPHLDAFAQQAVVFENAYAPAPTTPTSFASAFTGSYPSRAFRDWRMIGDTTLAGVFAAAGYRTAAFANNPQLAAERGFGRGFEHYVVRPAMGDAWLLSSALSWLEQHRDERLLLWLHWLDPHAPWVLREDAAHLYDEEYEGPYDRRAERLLVVRDPVDLARVRSLYDGEIHGVDALFGRLMTGLGELGLSDGTIVVVTSDHGEEFMEHGHVQHGWLTEENVRVPLMIRHPGVEGGVRVEARVSHFDLLPTLAALVGLPVPPGLDGRSWLEPLPMGRSLVAVANTDDALLAASLTEGRMKLIVHCGRRRSPELYDLVADPRERSNLAADRPQQVVRLAAELWRRLDVAGCESLAMTPPGRSGDATRGLANDQKEALEALGYLE